MRRRLHAPSYGPARTPSATRTCRLVPRAGPRGRARRGRRAQPGRGEAPPPPRPIWSASAWCAETVRTGRRPGWPWPGTCPCRPRPRSPPEHTASADAFAAAVGSVLSMAGPPLGLLAAAVGSSHVHAGVHYPGDVAAGALLGFASAATVRECSTIGGITARFTKDLLTLHPQLEGRLGEGIGRRHHRVVPFRALGAREASPTLRTLPGRSIWPATTSSTCLPLLMRQRRARTRRGWFP